MNIIKISKVIKIITCLYVHNIHLHINYISALFFWSNHGPHPCTYMTNTRVTCKNWLSKSSHAWVMPLSRSTTSSWKSCETSYYQHLTRTIIKARNICPICEKDLLKHGSHTKQCIFYLFKWSQQLKRNGRSPPGQLLDRLRNGQLLLSPPWKDPTVAENHLGIKCAASLHYCILNSHRGLNVLWTYILSGWRKSSETIQRESWDSSIFSKMLKTSFCLQIAKIVWQKSYLLRTIGVSLPSHKQE